MPWACGTDERNRPHSACYPGTDTGFGSGFYSGCDACPSACSGAHTGR